MRNERGTATTKLASSEEGLGLSGPAAAPGRIYRPREPALRRCVRRPWLAAVARPGSPPWFAAAASGENAHWAAPGAASAR
jgi:hypothetical protein